jgi:type IV pilus assembly protein PilC
MSQKMTPQNTILLYRNLAAAARHDLPFTDLFAILREDPDLFSQKIPTVVLMHEALKAGNSLSEAMKCVPWQFPAETAALIGYAGKSDQLPATLDLLADEQAGSAQTGKMIRSAIAWPLTLLTFATVITFLAMIFVIPAFKEMFNSFGADLPAPTLFLTDLSEFMVAYWWLFVALVVGGWVAVKRNLLPLSLSLFMERLILFIPSVRNYMVHTFGFRLLIWLTLCVRQPDMQPLILAHLKASTSFHVFSKVFDELSSRLNSGQALGHALDHLSPLPRRMALQIQIGEKTGNTEGAIAFAIDASEAQFASIQLNFGRGIFLVSYFVAGVTIGFIVIALYLPIFKMGQVV